MPNRTSLRIRLLRIWFLRIWFLRVSLQPRVSLSRIILMGLVLLLPSTAAKAESLAGYYLRFFRNQGIFDALAGLTYTVCGVMSLYNGMLVFQKMNEGDVEGGRNARTWALSLLLIAGCTYFVSALVTDSYSMAQINFGAHLQSTTTKLSGTYTVVRNLVYVTCGVIALLVLPEKFRAMQEGNPGAGRSVTNWGLGLLVVCIGAYVIHLFFFN